LWQFDDACSTRVEEGARELLSSKTSGEPISVVGFRTAHHERVAAAPERFESDGDERLLGLAARGRRRAPERARVTYKDSRSTFRLARLERRAPDVPLVRVVRVNAVDELVGADFDAPRPVWKYTRLGPPGIFSHGAISVASRPIRLLLGQEEFYRPLLDARRGNVVETAPNW